jgi:hypothetical protein
MKKNKKLFKHGNSLAVVVPIEFTKKLSSQEVIMEVRVDENGFPILIITPETHLDKLENDPIFAQFIEAIYKNALTYPEKLKETSDVWPENIKELLEGVSVDGED